MPNPRKPTVMKKLQGNPGGRPYNELEPIPDVFDRFPDPPDMLDSIARNEWLRTGPALFSVGLLTPLDISSFESYCVEWSKYQNANIGLSETGTIIKAPSGYPVLNPLVGVADRAFKNCVKLAASFGLTPSGRSGLQVRPKKKEDPLENFMSKK